MRFGIKGSKTTGLGFLSLLIVTGSYGQGGKIQVRNKSELLAALKTAGSGQTIFIPDTVRMDLTGVQKLVIPTNVTLASGGGKGGKGGALLYTNTNGTLPLFRLSHKNGRITGLRIKGPDTAVYAGGIDHFRGKSAEDRKTNRLKYYKENMYGVPVSRGVVVTATGARIDHCELYGWTHAAILVNEGGDHAQVLDNYIHHNQRFGLGYGVDVDQGSAYVAGNTFDYNSHSVAGTGRPGTSYEAAENIFKQHHLRAWAVDMHGGKDRNDGTDIAGSMIKVHNNIFYVNYRPDMVKGVVIRGVPLEEAIIENNTFYVLGAKKNGISDLNSSAVILQKNAKGKMIVSDNEIIAE